MLLLFYAASHISAVDSAKMVENRPRQLANNFGVVKIFVKKRGVRTKTSSKSCFKKTRTFKLIQEDLKWKGCSSRATFFPLHTRWFSDCKPTRWVVLHSTRLEKNQINLNMTNDIRVEQNRRKQWDVIVHYFVAHLYTSDVCRRQCRSKAVYTWYSSWCLSPKRNLCSGYILRVCL